MIPARLATRQVDAKSEDIINVNGMEKQTSHVSNLSVVESNLDLTNTDDTQDTASASNSTSISYRKESKARFHEPCNSSCYHQFECLSPQTSTFTSINCIHSMNDNLSFSTINTNEEGSSDTSQFLDCINEESLTKQRSQSNHPHSNEDQCCFETFHSPSNSVINNQVQNIITEQSIFARAIFSLLMDRKKRIEEKKIVTYKDESNIILKSGRLMKGNNILKRQWAPKYVEITRGSLIYEDDDDNIGIMKRLFSYSPSHSASNLFTTTDFLYDSNEPTVSPVEPYQTQNKRKTLPLRRNKCTCRAVKLRNEELAHYASPSPSRLLSNNTKNASLFELTIENGPKRLWMAKSKEDRTAWIHAIHKAMIDKESYDDDDLVGTKNICFNRGDNSSNETHFHLFIPRTHIHSLYENDIKSCISLQREIIKAGNSNENLQSALEFSMEKKSLCVPMSWVNKMLQVTKELNHGHEIETQNGCKLKTEMHSLVKINGVHFNINEGNGLEKVLGELSSSILNPRFHNVDDNRINKTNNESTRETYKNHAIDECAAVAFAFNTLVSSRTYGNDDKLRQFLEILFSNTYNLLSIQLQPTDSETIEINVSHENDIKQEEIKKKQNKCLQGWLSISNKVTKKWRKFFCVLSSNGVFRYYEKSKPHPHGLRGEMVLHHAIMATSESGKGTYIIVIISSDKSKKLKLWFKNWNKFSLWVKTLEQAIYGTNLSKSDKDNLENYDPIPSVTRRDDNQESWNVSDIESFHSQLKSVSDIISTDSFCAGWIKIRKGVNKELKLFFCTLSDAGRFTYSEPDKNSCEEIQLQHRLRTLKQGGKEGSEIVISSIDQLTQLHLYFDQEDNFLKWKHSFHRILDQTNVIHFEASQLEKQCPQKISPNSDDKGSTCGIKATSICKGLSTKGAIPITNEQELQNISQLNGNEDIDQSLYIIQEYSTPIPNKIDNQMQVPSHINHQFLVKEKLDHFTCNSYVNITMEIPESYKIYIKGAGDDIGDSPFLLNMKIKIKKSFRCCMKQMNQEQDIIDIVFEQVIKNDIEKTRLNHNHYHHDQTESLNESTNEDVAELSPQVSSHTLYTSNIDEIQLYIGLFHSPVLWYRLNEAMDQQINTIQSAEMLQQYYIVRSKLKNYTFEESLSNFKYTVHTESTEIVFTDVKSIENKYKQFQNRKTIEEDIIWRAANISLIDSIIPSLVNLQSPLYRKDLLITAVVKKCHFILFLDLTKKMRLKCLCDIAFCMPNITPEIGTIQLQICFTPSASVGSPKLCCKVTSVNPSPISHDEIQILAEKLTDNILHNDDDHDNDIFFLSHSYMLRKAAGEHDDTLYSFSFLPPTKVFDEIDKVSLAHYLWLLIFSFKPLWPIEKSIESTIRFLCFVYDWWCKCNSSKPKCSFG